MRQMPGALSTNGCGRPLLPRHGHAPAQQNWKELHFMTGGAGGETGWVAAAPETSLFWAKNNDFGKCSSGEGHSSYWVSLSYRAETAPWIDDALPDQRFDCAQIPWRQASGPVRPALLQEMPSPADLPARLSWVALPVHLGIHF
jgi:hypothetical protein